MTAMEYLGLLRLAAIVGTFYVLWPVLMRCTLRLALTPQAVAIDLRGKVVAEVLPDGSGDAAKALEAEGFERLAAVHIGQAVGATRAFLVLWVNRDACALATMSMVSDDSGPWQCRLNYVEFVTRFRDGTVIETNNASALSPFAPKVHHNSGKFPRLEDVRLLYRLHRARCRRHGPVAPKIMRLDRDFGGDAAAYVVGIMAEDFEQQRAAGYLWLPAGATDYRPTLKGAFLMAWKSLFPVKQLLEASCRRAARREIAELTG